MYYIVLPFGNQRNNFAIIVEFDAARAAAAIWHTSNGTKKNRNNKREQKQKLNFQRKIAFYEFFVQNIKIKYTRHQKFKTWYVIFTEMGIEYIERETWKQEKDEIMLKVQKNRKKIPQKLHSSKKNDKINSIEREREVTNTFTLLFFVIYLFVYSFTFIFVCLAAKYEKNYWK